MKVVRQTGAQVREAGIARFSLAFLTRYVFELGVRFCTRARILII
jgi:hypothetical protein